VVDQKTVVVKTGWQSKATWWSALSLIFLSASGLLITFGPFHSIVQWNVLAHTVVGLLAVIPLLWYCLVHWDDYRRYNMSDVLLLGYLAVAALLICIISGLVVTWQSLFGLRLSPLWRNIHLYSTLISLGAGIPHALLVYFRLRATKKLPAFGKAVVMPVAVTCLCFLAIGGLSWFYGGQQYVNEFPADYSFLYGEDRPFAPSLAMTASGGAFDAESLAGSESCGSANCHTQILEEWKPSAHRYAAQDPLFQKVQSVMAEQNGPESTRYCGGCHDPISLFSGSKNIYSEELTGAHGYEEGISCLSCHGVRETDLQGNAAYVMTQPPTYLWQWSESPRNKFVSDFLIRSYPDEHKKLSKRMYKAPEYCAACHKQFIDEEVNRVGWVQLQNQYDNWKASHWFVEGSPEKSIECRECHMPLVESTDPARGDEADYNRNPNDGRHRSHRFIGANEMVPAMLELEGWEEHVRLTREWLKGEFPIPEIQDKWRDGPVVGMELEVPEAVQPGQEVPIRVILTANKVGHDFPTGPLDIIQSWVELHVSDGLGNEIYSSGTRDENHFIEPGSFLFKAEPVDQFGNLIDRHNLWEMVGVRYRRALFPGYSDTVEYMIQCPTTVAAGEQTDLARTGREVQDFTIEAEAGAGPLEIVAILQYRKVDQYLVNFLLGEDSGLTAPVIEMNRVRAEVAVQDEVLQASVTDSRSALKERVGG
jgi:hypothetical protein